MQSSGKTLKIVLVVLASVVLLAVGLHWWRKQDLQDPALVIRFEAGSGGVRSLSFSTNGDELIVGNSGGTIEIYDPTTGRRKQTWNTQLDELTQMVVPTTDRSSLQQERNPEMACIKARSRLGRSLGRGVSWPCYRQSKRTEGLMVDRLILATRVQCHLTAAI